MQLQEHRSEFEATGAEIAALTFEAPHFAERYLEETGWPWPLLVDQDRRAYRDYGLIQGSRWAVLGPHLWPGYLKLIFSRAAKIETPHDDIYQLGGNFVIDTEGHIVLAHRSRSPLDRPTVDVLLEALEQAGESGTGER